MDVSSLILIWTVIAASGVALTALIGSACLLPTRREAGLALPNPEH